MDYYCDLPPSSLSPPSDDDDLSIYHNPQQYNMDISKHNPNSAPNHHNHHPHHNGNGNSNNTQWTHVPYTSPPTSSSFLQDLYDPLPPMEDHMSSQSDSPGNTTHMQYHPSPPPPQVYKQPIQDWTMGGAISSMDHHDGYYRRATYPYIRQEEHHPSAYQQQMHQQIPPMQSHPHQMHPILDVSGLKFEHSSPVVVPTQHILPSPSPYYGHPDSRPGSSHSHMSDGSGYIPSHPAPTIMHTSDAASKETQWLRRRCFNCHQTEPPSWRRSTLNPGKIVCNKCGLYERTHLRARPHRFDELRANTKNRKASQQTVPQPPVVNKLSSPKSRPIAPPSYIKKEPHEYPLPHSNARHRRGSTASTASSGISGNQSDWDESASSVYDPNTSSVSSSVYSSPHVGPYNIPTQPSPPPPPSSYDGAHSLPIQIPSAPLVGGNTPVPATIDTEPPSNIPPIARAHTPLKSHTTPYYGDRRTHMDRRFTTGNVPHFNSSPSWESVTTGPATTELESEAPAATV